MDCSTLDVPSDTIQHCQSTMLSYRMYEDVSKWLLSCRNDEKSASQGALITSMKDDFDRLHADVEGLQLKHKDLLQRTETCCQSKAQLDAQIRAGLNDYLMMASWHLLLASESRLRGCFICNCCSEKSESFSRNIMHLQRHLLATEPV